jgi:hypothetical protein
MHPDALSEAQTFLAHARCKFEQALRTSEPIETEILIQLGHAFIAAAAMIERAVSPDFAASRA